MTITFKKRAASLLFLFPLFIAALLVITSCSEPATSSFQLSGMTMGTTYHITVVEPDISNGEPQAQLGPDDLKARVDLRLALLNQQMSTYMDNSELSKLNRVPVDQWIELSPELYDVLVLSLELGWLTNGALDISVAPLVDLWGFGPGKTQMPDQHVIPTQSQINRVLDNVGFSYLEFDLLAGKVRKQRDIKLDLSSIAKGYGVDKLAELLLSAGYKNFMVEVGGELRLHGNSPRGTPWRIAIEQPGDGFGEVHGAVTLSGVGMATSGDYRNYFEHDGKRFSHLIDPRTGAPITHNLVSVTVIAETSAYADGLATAISVMGTEHGIMLAQQQNLAVYMISKTKDGFKTTVSDAFKPYLK